MDEAAIGAQTATPEPPLVIEHREALVYLLGEACELEHGLMCEYLYAAFSLKRGEDEGLTPAQADAVGRWRRTILDIATQEMLHLALANNMLAALGAAPHFSRPNLPDLAHHYPADVQLAFLPFGERALRHFLYLERPEGMALHDAEGFAALDQAVPVVSPDDIVPRPQDFATVGHLYRSIEQGFRHLADRMGEDRLFVGSPRAQATGGLFGWPELIAVTGVDSASRAIATIIEEGEGAQGNWRDAHFGRFLEVLDDYTRMRADDPDFAPTRRVAATSVRRLADLQPEVTCTDPLTAGVLDGFNTGYEVLLQLLERFFGHDTEDDAQLATLAAAAVRVMTGVLAPLGNLVTTLPVGPADPGVTAGPMFELFYGTGYLLPRQREAWLLMRERTALLAGFLRRLPAQGAAAEILARTARTADEVAGLLDPDAATQPKPPAQPDMTAQPAAQPTFARDIRPLFTEQDRTSMSWLLDLWSAPDVRAHAHAVLDTIESGRMPCYGPWPGDRVDLLRRWLSAGMPD